MFKAEDVNTLNYDNYFKLFQPFELHLNIRSITR